MTNANFWRNSLLYLLLLMFLLFIYLYLARTLQCICICSCIVSGVNLFFVVSFFRELVARSLEHAVCVLFTKYAQQYLHKFFAFSLAVFSTWKFFFFCEILYFALAETFRTANGFQLNASSLRRRLLYASWQRQRLLSAYRIPLRSKEWERERVRKRERLRAALNIFEWV